MSLRSYRQAVELSHMRRLMNYTAEDFARDWESAIALGQLLAVEVTPARERLLDAAMMRVLAWGASHPNAFDEYLASRAQKRD